MKIVDSFIFNNELDLLNYRLTILNDYIDYFVLVESKYSFSGHEKELFYENNKHLFEKFQNKIIHIVLNELPYKFPNINYEINQQWENETFNRNQISLGINKLELNNEDIIITSDLDEIINPQILFQVKNNSLVFDKNGLNRLALDMYYYNLNTLRGRECWHGVKLLTYESYKKMNLSFQDMRVHEWSNHVNIIPKGGWHLSYFGDVEFIKSKIKYFSHQEFNNDKYVNDQFLMECIKNSGNLYDDPEFIGYISIKENTFLPPDYNKYLTNYYLE